jgi:hypothetical protein
VNAIAPPENSIGSIRLSPHSTTSEQEAEGASVELERLFQHAVAGQGGDFRPQREREWLQRSVRGGQS